MRLKDGLVDDLTKEVPEKSKAEIEWQKGQNPWFLRQPLQNAKARAARTDWARTEDGIYL